MGTRTARSLIVLLVLALTGAAAASGHIERKDSYRSGKEKLRSVRIENLAGVAKLVAAKGDELVIEYTVVAEGDLADKLAERVVLRTTLEGGALRAHFDYPVDDYRVFVYRDKDSGWGNNTTSEYQGRRVQVTSSARGRDAAEVHVDVTVQVPKGVAVRFEDKVGGIDAQGVASDLELDTGSGAVTGSGNRGRFSADTGSGQVELRDHQGRVEVDTGSGDVLLDHLTGDADVDTGSGDVIVRDSKGERFSIDTGSGAVELERVGVSAALDVDTGSGGLRGREFTAGEKLHVDTGSGGVRLSGDLSALRDVDIDTGSGGVTLETSKPLDLRLSIDASSGGVHVELPAMRDVRSERGEFEATVGDGKGHAVIETGSGGVRISMMR